MSMTSGKRHSPARKSNPEDYRIFLKEELDARIEQNPRYSLRAFARDLKIAPSRLSEILNHKQGLSRKAAEQIADRINLDSDEKEYFIDLVTAAHARSPKDRDYARMRLIKWQQQTDVFYQLKVDTFKIIADWYHLGILELLSLKGFKNDSRWIARRLKITPIQAELAIERLIRVGLLEKKSEELVATTNTGWIQSEIPSESIRKFHKQILDKAAEALTMQHIDQREFSSNVLTINRKDVPMAKRSIRKFQERFCNEIKNTEHHDELYCLSFQFFSLTERGNP